MDIYDRLWHAFLRLKVGGYRGYARHLARALAEIDEDNRKAAENLPCILRSPKYPRFILPKPRV